MKGMDGIFELIKDIEQRCKADPDNTTIVTFDERQNIISSSEYVKRNLSEGIEWFYERDNGEMPKFEIRTKIVYSMRLKMFRYSSSSGEAGE